MAEEGRSFWDRVFNTRTSNERERKVIEYIIHRGWGAPQGRAGGRVRPSQRLARGDRGHTRQSTPRRGRPREHGEGLLLW